MNFADPRSDIGFKKIFGDEEHKGVLISFLNAVLGFEGMCAIEAVSILNPYQAPRIEGLKETTLDVKARDGRGVEFIVEMQARGQDFFAKRAQYYAAKAYVGQIDRGDNYPRLNQVIFIGILGFDLFAGEGYLTRHRILNTVTMQQELKDLEFAFIELPKFRESLSELSGMVDKWTYFIKHCAGTQEIPDALRADEPIVEAYGIADRTCWSKRELELYDYWSMYEGGRQDEIRTAERKAQEKGRLEGEQLGLEKSEKLGLAKGRMEGKLEIARNMLAAGIDFVTIARVTGLSEADITKLG